MGCYMKVILQVLNILTTVLGINEFRFDAATQKFVKSRWWRLYSWIWHLTCLFPIAIYLLRLDKIISHIYIEADFMHLTLIIYRAMLTTLFIGISASACIMFHQRNELLDLINHWLSVGRMHRQMFGRPVSISAIYLIVHVIRGLQSASLFVPNWSRMVYITYQARCYMLFLLADFALVLLRNCLQSLKDCLDHSLELGRTERSQCLKYFVELMRIRRLLQKLFWATFITRLIVDMLFITIRSLVYYWEASLNTTIAILYYLFISNSFYSVQIARGIDILEHQVLNDMYKNELLVSMRRPKSYRNKRLLKLELLVLKRSTLKERSVNFFNCIYIRPSLVLEIFDFAFAHILLMISFSLRHVISENIPKADVFSKSIL